jgi:excisionase family DNA binding protein
MEMTERSLRAAILGSLDQRYDEEQEIEREKRATTPTKRPLTIKEAADKIGVSEKTIRRWCKAGKMRHTQNDIGGVILIPEAEVLRYVHGCP